MTAVLVFLIALSLAAWRVWVFYVNNPPASMVDYYRTIFSEGNRFLATLKEADIKKEDLDLYPPSVRENIIAQWGFDPVLLDEFFKVAANRPEYNGGKSVSQEGERHAYHKTRTAQRRARHF